MVQAIQATGGFGRWITSLILIALILSATFLAVTAFFPGDTYWGRLAEAYTVLRNSTNQQLFTDIMRERPHLYLIPALGIIFVSGWQLPRRYWARAVYTYIVFGIGFVGGHVFW